MTQHVDSIIRPEDPMDIDEDADWENGTAPEDTNFTANEAPRE